MRVGLIDVDGHNFPNLPLMKLSEYHKMQGDSTEMCIPLCRYDLCYQSKIFSDIYTPDIDWVPMADEIVKGGRGYGADHALPDAVEHTYPDYSLYGITDTAYGFLTRGCPRDCEFCDITQKEGCMSRKVADLGEFWNGQKNIVLMDANLLACGDHLELMEQLAKSKAWIDVNQGFDIRLCDDSEIDAINQTRIKNIHFSWDNPHDDLEYRFLHYTERATNRPHGRFGTVYVLTNRGSTFEQDMYRVSVLDALGFAPYVMIYDKPNADREHRLFQRWVNNSKLFKSCTWDEYDRRR